MIRRTNSFWFYLLGIIIFLLFLFQLKGSFRLPFYWDTGSFLIQTAENMANKPDYFSSWQQSSDYPHTFLLPLFLSLFFHLNINHILVFHILSFFFSLFCLFSIYLIHKRFVNKRLALLALLLYVSNPLFIAQTEILYFEIIAMAFRFLTLHFLFEKRGKLALFSALLAFLIRFENGIILSFVFLLNFLLNKKKSNFFSTIVMLFSSFVWLFFHFVKTGWFLYSPLRYFEEKPWQTFLELSHYLFLEQGRLFITVTIIIFGVIFILRKKEIKILQKQYFLLILAATLPTIAIIVKLGYFLPRYLLPLFLPLYLLLIFFAEQLRIPKKNIFLVSLIILISSFAQYQHRYDCFAGNYEDCQVLPNLIQGKKEAAGFLEKHPNRGVVLVDFPENLELSDPSLGFVEQAIDNVYFKEKDLKNPDDIINMKFIYLSPTSSEEIHNLSQTKNYSLLETFQVDQTDLKIEIYKNNNE